LRAFHAVAVEGSFSRAARRLNVSQPTLSQQIKALEGRYGRMLFEGRRLPLRLTPIGQDLVALTQKMFATSDTIEALLGDHPAGELHTIRLAADSPAYAAMLAQALLEADPALGLEVQIENSQRTLAQLLEARADVAIISDPQIDPRFAYTPLFLDSLRVVVPSSHRLARAPVFPLAALEHECLLVREPASKTRAAAEALLRSCDIRPVRSIEFRSREAIREAVARGMGVGLFFSSECPPDSRLVTIAPDAQPDSSFLTGYLVCCVEHRRSNMMRLVFDAARSIKEAGSLAPGEELGPDGKSQSPLIGTHCD
jgi:DNA-binding transcriptional LysR family regulator